MKNEKQANSDDEKYSKICDGLAIGIFEYMLKNGGTSVPMPYLIEMFLMLAAKISEDFREKTNSDVEEIIEAGCSMYTQHVQLYYAENAGTILPMDKSTVN